MKCEKNRTLPNRLLDSIHERLARKANAHDMFVDRDALNSMGTGGKRHIIESSPHDLDLLFGRNLYLWGEHDLVTHSGFIARVSLSLGGDE
jgi:hypothetical protein